MSYEDYSEEEIKNIIDELSTTYALKLKVIEHVFLNMLRELKRITNDDRDTLISIYDRVRDNSGE